MKEQTYHTYDLYGVYRKIILLAIFAHSAYAILSFVIVQSLLAIYNITSVLFYCGMLLLAKKSLFKLIVSMIHLEVALFVMISIVILGWDSGFALLLIAMASLVYFCPFDQTWVAYLISLSEVLIFIIIKQISDLSVPLVVLDHTSIRWIYLLNAMASFAIILYGSYITNISSHLREKQLCEENENLQAIAYYDQLTGCWSRQHMEESIRNKNIHPSYLALGDIDDFKKVNDRYGHLCGDEVLREVAAIMKNAICHTDGIIRWGGEEFLVLFEEDEEGIILQYVEAIREQIAAHEFRYEEESFHITMTFGISRIDQDIKEAIRISDIKMYEGKRDGKNRLQR